MRRSTFYKNKDVADEEYDEEDDELEEDEQDEEEEDEEEENIIKRSRAMNHDVAFTTTTTTTTTQRKKLGGGGNSSSSTSNSTSTTTASCQAENCPADMKVAKRYHQRHKVCEYHAKAPMVRVASLWQRFCQQCSRFHELAEFDETKRSCRRRLAGHNQRRRKSSYDPHGDE